MASWSIFANALALNPTLTLLATSGSTDVLKLFDGSQVSRYTIEGEVGWYVSINLGDSQDIAGHLLGNLDSSLTGKTLRIGKASTLGGTITDEDEFTVGSDPDQLFVTSSFTSAQYVTFTFPTSIVSAAIGSIEIFGTRIDLTGAEPRFSSSGHELELGHAVLDTPGGGEVMQIVGGQRNTLSLGFDKVGPTLSAEIEESLRATSSWANGIAITDYNWGPEQGPALYGRPLPGSPIRRPWSDSTGRKTYTLQFREFSKGVTA